MRRLVVHSHGKNIEEYMRTCRECGRMWCSGAGVRIARSHQSFELRVWSGWRRVGAIVAAPPHHHRHSSPSMTSPIAPALWRAGHQDSGRSPPTHTKELPGPVAFRFFVAHSPSRRHRCAIVCRNRTCLLYIGQRRARFTILKDRSRPPTTRRIPTLRQPHRRQYFLSVFE